MASPVWAVDVVEAALVCACCVAGPEPVSKVLEAVGVTGLFGWLLVGSGLWSLVRFFLRKPREGMKTDDAVRLGRERWGSRSNWVTWGAADG
jgi:hypothetical protein